MKIIEGKLYLEIKDAVEAGLGDSNYINKEKSRGCKWVTFIKDPADNRRTLLDYESLSEQKRAMVLTKFGNPYELLAKDPIRKMVQKDLDAERFFLQYRYDEKALPTDRVAKYTEAASWLNMLCEAESNKKAIKANLNLSLAQFWIHVGELIDRFDIALPSNYKRLREKIKEYSDCQNKQDAYRSLIHKHFGNTSAKKVSTEVAESLLLELMANGNQLDDVFICYQYNNWAASQQLKPITPATVGNYRRKNLPYIITERHGSDHFNELFITEQKGFRPKHPFALWEHDDNNLDFLFSDASGYEFNRYVSVVVIDSSCDLVLGKSYTVGRQPEPWMVRHAYLDAMRYIKQMTGDYYLPFELKSDNWRKEELVPFYDKIGTYIKAGHGNKHRGYVEQFFSSGLWKRMQKVGSVNYNGNNLSAKHRGVNMQALVANRKVRPLIGNEAESQIESFFERLRKFPDITRENMNAPCKEDQWLEAFEKLPADRKRKINSEQFYLTFGITHNPSRPIEITNRGIEPMISGHQYSYNIPAHLNKLDLIRRKVNVIYDPYDMSQVLVTNHEDIRFIAQEAVLQPRAIKDAYEGSRTYLNALISEKLYQVEKVASASTKRKRILQETGFDAEAILKSGVITKQLKNNAEAEYIGRQLPKSDSVDPYDMM